MPVTTELTARSTPLAAGDAAPDFTLMTQDRQEWTLSEAVKQGDVVLCFYPMDFSSVCSTEMKCVTDDLAKWTAKGAQVVGVSCDSFFVHKAWAEQLGLRQTLLADMHRAVCKAYGMYWPDLNVSARGTIIIAKATDGKPRVKWVQKREIPQAMNPDEILAAIA
ncbi:MAG: redoxin domain-containing protein [Phycisphaerales bacterium]|jgi:peroxiredoxin|nr:redoxin domain-containing protein [Phycisphaerales bacterium]